MSGRSEIPDDRERARARLEARMARREAEQGGGAISRRGTKPIRPEGAARNMGSSRPMRSLRSAGAARPSAVNSSRDTSRGRSNAAITSRRMRAARGGRVVRGGGVLSGLNPRILLLVLIAVLLIVALTFTIRSCSSAPDEGFTDVDGGQQQAISGTGAEEGSGDGPEEPAIDQAALASIMGDDLAAQMVELSANNEDLYWIASHPEAVGVDGAKAQRKLLKLATVEPAAITFVRDYPDLYPDNTAGACDPLSADVDIPLLMQWDQRWGYTVYSSAAFGQTGCCPTCMAMVYQGITRKTDMSPYDMGQLSRENGFMAQYAGTDSQFLLSCAPKLGLTSTKISVSEDALRDALSAGNVVIANVGPGDFTEGGHYIVLTGLDSEGRVVVNDPYSVINSERTWTVGEIVSQTKALLAFER